MSKVSIFLSKDYVSSGGVVSETESARVHSYDSDGILSIDLNSIGSIELEVKVDKCCKSKNDSESCRGEHHCS